LKSACHGSAIAALIVRGPTDGANRNGAAYDDSRTGQRHHWAHPPRCRGRRPHRRPPPERPGPASASVV